MNTGFPKDFLWGGATADFQYEGGFNEGGRGINSQDFVTSGSVKQKRQITLQLKDGSRGTVNSLESFPDGAENCMMMYIIHHIRQWISIITIRKILL